ncbi:MAG: hypothetical protein GY850_38490 [bacterium]|nr:hypothetical protein [bacterium]
MIDLFFNEMANALANGDWVEIRGLSSFYVKKYKAYTGRNPKTGENVKGANRPSSSQDFYSSALWPHDNIALSL